MSLIEILVAMGVMSILMLAFTQMMTQQIKQTSALEQTLARLDVERTLSTFLADGSVCKASLETQTFNEAALASTSFNVSNLPSSTHSGALYLIEANKQASALSGSLKVNTIVYKNIQSTGITNKYNMDLEVTFTGGIRPLKPLIFKMILNTENSTTAGVKNITGCNTSGMTADICNSFDGFWNPSTGKCSGVGSNWGMTAAECSDINGIYDSVNKICNDSGVQEYSGTTCPAPKQMIAGYWDPKTCTGCPNFPTINTCTTVGGGWLPNPPSSCDYYGHVDRLGNHGWLKCLPPLQTKVRCK